MSAVEALAIDETGSLPWGIRELSCRCSSTVDADWGADV
jgi:hypothetical protein